MKISFEHVDDPVVAMRQLRRLQLLAWLSLLIPLAIFGWLGYQSYDLNKSMDDVRAQKERATEDLKKLKSEIADLREQKQLLSEDSKYYRNALDVKVRFYRAEDQRKLQEPLRKIGIEAELREDLRRLDLPANTLAYGPKVSPNDCRAVAKALVQAGFPLLRIAAATRVQESNLLQIYASGKTAQTYSVVLTPERIDREPCGGSAK